MAFEKTFEVKVPDCSPEELVKMVWELADGLPRESCLTGPGEGQIGDIGWSHGFDVAELARITALDAQNNMDVRGKTLLCVEETVSLADPGRVLGLFRENGFLPSAQGFMAAILLYSCREIASLPLPDGNGGSVIWYTGFSPGSSVQEEPDSRSFHADSVEKAGQGMMTMLGFRIKE